MKFITLCIGLFTLMGCTMKYEDVAKAESRCKELGGNVRYVKNDWFPEQVQSVQCYINGNLFSFGNY